MAIGDLLFSLMGQPNPQAQLAQQLGQYPGQAGSRSGPVPGPGAGAAAPGLAQQGGGANSPGQPPQQQQQQAPPQPQAYQTPQDMGQLYLQLMQRQQANASINTGLGLLAGAFSHNQQDRDNMIGAMSDLNKSMPSAGDQLQTVAALQQTMWQRNMLLQQLQNAPMYAKQLNMPVEQVTAYIQAGKLPELMTEIERQKLVQADPLHVAQTAEAGATTAKTTAETGAIPFTIAKTQAETDQAAAATAEAKARTPTIAPAAAATIAKTQADTAEAQARLPTIAPAAAATIAKTGAETAEVQARTPTIQPAAAAALEKSKADTAATMATIPKTQADVAAIQAQTAKTQQDTKLPTEQIKNYSFYANDELAGKRQPVAFNDWLASGGMNPTEGMKDYRLAMSQVPEGQPKPSFDEWNAKNAGMKEAMTQSALLQTQQKMNAQNQLPDATQKITEQLKLADDIINDKSLESLTGWGGTGIGKVIRAMPGTAGASLQAKIDQLSGSAGVSAVESLKGVGRILGTEFAAGTEAQSRLHDQTIPGTDYKKAITDYRNKIAGQLRIVYDKAGMPVPKELDDQLKGAAAQTKQWKRDANGNLVPQ